MLERFRSGSRPDLRSMRAMCSRIRSVVNYLTLPLLLGALQAPARAQYVTAADSSWRTHHKPARATLYSAVLPGAGQIYNRKYWKAPIVWGGLGTCAYFINRNQQEYFRYRDGYIALIDNDPNTVSEFNASNANSVRDVADTYRKWRDLSYIALVGVYILNVVDANVDAHFVRFDVGDDLSLNLGPSPAMAAQNAVGLSVALQLH